MAEAIGSIVHTSRVFDPRSRHEGDDRGYEIECDYWGWIAAADNRRHADVLARLHEEFVTVVMDGWEVPS